MLLTLINLKTAHWCGAIGDLKNIMIINFWSFLIPKIMFLIIIKKIKFCLFKSTIQFIIVHEEL